MVDVNGVPLSQAPLGQCLTRKRQHASRAGEVFISAYAILGA